MENNKIKAVKEWKTSTKIKKVEIFLEFANFYQQFIKNFNYIMKPLNELKEKKIEIGRRILKTFKELKNKITSQLVLTFLKKEGKFRVEIDALGYVIGEVLS